MLHRRSFITGLVALVAAPAIVRAGSLMPVKAERMLTTREIIDEALARMGREEVFTFRTGLLTGTWREINCGPVGFTARYITPSEYLRDIPLMPALTVDRRPEGVPPET